MQRIGDAVGIGHAKHTNIWLENPLGDVLTSDPVDWPEKVQELLPRNGHTKKFKVQEPREREESDRSPVLGGTQNNFGGVPRYYM